MFSGGERADSDGHPHLRGGHCKLDDGMVWVSTLLDELWLVGSGGRHGFNSTTTFGVGSELTVSFLNKIHLPFVGRKELFKPGWSSRV